LVTKVKDTISRQTVKRIAALELNALLYTNVLPYETFNNSIIRSPGTPIHDINGELLYYRIPILKGRNLIAYSDIAANSVFGSPLIAISSGQEWNEKYILNKAISIVRRHHKREFDKIRLVAYSFPKIAIQFLNHEEETLMLEFGTWVPVPEEAKNESDVNFKRWSLIEEIPRKTKLIRRKAFEKRISNWEKTFLPKESLIPIMSLLIDLRELSLKLLGSVVTVVSLFTAQQLLIILHVMKYVGSLPVYGVLQGVYKCYLISIGTTMTRQE
jgi:hypothetical protein